MLILDNVSKKYEGFNLKPINFKLEDHEFMCIIGSTGSGKTLILDLISGIKFPDSGRILLNGQDLSRIPIHKRAISVVYQDSFLFPHLSVEENIRYGLKHRKIKGFDFDYIVDFFKISHLLKRNVLNLSGGERQRIALARAIIVKPSLLLLDEPLSAIDETLRRDMLNIVNRVHRELGLMTIMVTHNLGDLWSVADKVLLIESGVPLQFGTIEELFNSPNDEKVAFFVKMTNVFTLSRATLKSLFGLETKNVSSKVVKIGIRPEDIEVNEKPVKGKCSILSKISGIVNEGPYFSIYSKYNDLVFHSFVSKNEFINHNISRDKEIYLNFDSKKIHIFGEY